MIPQNITHNENLGYHVTSGCANSHGLMATWTYQEKVCGDRHKWRNVVICMILYNVDSKNTRNAYYNLPSSFKKKDINLDV